MTPKMIGKTQTKIKNWSGFLKTQSEKKHNQLRIFSQFWKFETRKAEAQEFDR